jgi:K+-transporting ATPase ATPase C chain
MIMWSQIRASLVILGLLTLLTGVAYPLFVTGVAQAAFPRQANGSLLVRDGKFVGCSLIGQQFNEAKYFWGRLSATTPVPYNGGSSSGSNLGPTNSALTEAVKARVDALHAADPEANGPIPVDLVTASGSGLDPHISPAAAAYQVSRVAQARKMDETVVTLLVARFTTDRQLGVLGEPVVNVLELNLALDGR